MKSFSGESFPSFFFCIFLSLEIKLSAEEKTQSLQSEKCSGPVEVVNPTDSVELRLQLQLSSNLSGGNTCEVGQKGGWRQRHFFVLCGLLASEFFTWHFKEKNHLLWFQGALTVYLFLKQGKPTTFLKAIWKCWRKEWVSEWWVSEWQHGLSYRHTSGLCSSTYPNLSQFIPLA